MEQLKEHWHQEPKVAMEESWVQKEKRVEKYLVRKGKQGSKGTQA